MSAGARAMRRLSALLIGSLPTPTGDEDVIPLLGRALTTVRGRPVRLREAAFPPVTASGLWVDRASHDLIVYEKNTDPEHQLVIIGHEAWHMFHGQCGGGGYAREHAARASGGERPESLADFVAAVSTADEAEPPFTDPPFTDRTDAALHYAARSDSRKVDEEIEAEHFGLRLATDLQAALRLEESPVDPHHVSGRIGASMAHRFRQL
ncbi:toxin-antitoxin system, toxin component [Streptomyces sp. NPDC048106]|uniref:toxin-antitoxin system, toxin component n=1 Tax=Streptomyces sp. NPDC048106 TaxID=3155750 RepID=UPI00345614B3